MEAPVARLALNGGSLRQASVAGELVPQVVDGGVDVEPFDLLLVIPHIRIDFQTLLVEIQPVAA